MCHVRIIVYTIGVYSNHPTAGRFSVRYDYWDGCEAMNYPEPDTQAKLWVINKLARFIHDTKGQGSFNGMLEYINTSYVETYEAGGMVITNSLSHNEYMAWAEQIEEEG